MRSLLFAAVFCALVLAACSGTPQPTAAPVPPTVAPTSQISGDNSLATLAATIGAPIPVPGTLVVPDERETPNAPNEAPVTINNLYFTQTGGIAGVSLTIELRADGTLIRDDKTSTVSAADVHQITALISEIHFFDLQGIFTGPGSAADAYRYSLSVFSDSGSRTITSEDGMTPPELYHLYDAIRSLGSDS